MALSEEEQAEKIIRIIKQMIKNSGNVVYTQEDIIDPEIEAEIIGEG